MSAPATPKGFLFDPNRCTGCAACTLACSTENALGWGVSWRQIVPFNPERRPDIPSFHLSLACNHCDDAPCVAQCPTQAMRRDPVTGAVLVDGSRCIGCRYCAWVCPYDAPRFDAARGVMTKCTLCSHRLAAGGTPACVEACPTDALGYGPLAGEAARAEGREAPL
ncbi:MAG: 4Fe-4S dicluster domain-containing protein, partial [Gemmatimonadetes bacterium]|nr:4Fe-4S dicluster domain-containing protein [Gemmatimonadota bacterium]